MGQIAVLQAQQRQQRKQQQEHMFQTQLMLQAASAAVIHSPQPESANGSGTSEIAALKAQLAERDRQLAMTQQRQVTRAEPNTPQPRQAPPRPAPKASFEHSSAYEQDGKGGLVFNVYIENTGDAVVWSASAGNNLQDNYSDRRTSVVYPGRRQVVAGFNRAVPNSGRYETGCHSQ
jgi:hypothetical protein